MHCPPAARPSPAPRVRERSGEAAEPPAVRLRPSTRWGLLLLLLLAEILWLTWQFDFGVFAQADTAWARALWYAPRTLQWLLVCGAALAAIFGWHALNEVKGVGPGQYHALHSVQGVPPWRYLFAHAVSVVAFAAV